MVLITGTNDRTIADLRCALLRVGLISEKTTLNTLCTHLADRPHTFAVLHIIEKRRPSLAPAVLLARHRFGNVVHGALLTDGCAPDAVGKDNCDFLLPLSIAPKKLCETVVHTAISSVRRNPSEIMVGALKYRLFQKDFGILLKRFSFSDSYTALLCALMEAAPYGLSSHELMRLAFLPLGHCARTNVSHAIETINRHYFAAGFSQNGNPLIDYDHEKGYFLRV